MTEKTTLILVLGVVGALLTIACRYKNKDADAGRAVAGWTIFIIFALVTNYFTCAPCS